MLLRMHNDLMKRPLLPLSSVEVQNATLASPYLPDEPRLGLESDVHRGATLISTPRAKGGGGSSQVASSQPAARTSSGRVLMLPARYRNTVLIDHNKSASARSNGKLKNSVSCYSTSTMVKPPRKEEPMELPATSELGVLGTSIVEAHGVEHDFVETPMDNVGLSGQRAE